MGNPDPKTRRVITEDIRKLEKTEGREKGIARQDKEKKEEGNYLR
jgi:hypothetical protein